MGKSKSFRLEAAGWGFLGVTVLILLGPCIYFAFQITADHYSWNVPAGIGLVFAVILGAIITFIANTIIQRNNSAREKAAAKSTGKKKK